MGAIKKGNEVEVLEQAKVRDKGIYIRLVQNVGHWVNSVSDYGVLFAPIMENGKPGVKWVEFGTTTGEPSWMGGATPQKAQKARQIFEDIKSLSEDRLRKKYPKMYNTHYYLEHVDKKIQEAISIAKQKYYGGKNV